jgi:Asp-tRNA(Asn)/Glu-tRNA(Gln) amidotransferase A subunit family amidase
MLREAAYIYSKPLEENPEKFPRDVEKLLRSGSAILPAAYMEALQVRADAITKMLRVFSNNKVDYIIMPTTPVVAPKLADVLDEKVSRSGLDYSETPGYSIWSACPR